MTRDSVTKFFNRIYRALTHVKFVNLQVLPQEGPLILVLNHMSRIDFPLLCCNQRRGDWSAFVADSYQSWPVFRQVCDATGMVWIDRSKADFTAMKKALSWLKNGGMFVLAPEGTRSRTQQLLEAKTGVVMLAMKAGVPICTASITGTEFFMREFLHFRKPRLTMRFTPPVMLPPVDPDRREESLREGADELMCRLASMLPEKYRGHYRDFPRVQALIAEWKMTPGLELPEGE